MLKPLTELQELQWKASKYDDVVEALHVCDGGQYRNDTIESVLNAARTRPKVEFMLKSVTVRQPHETWQLSVFINSTLMGTFNGTRDDLVGRLKMSGAMLQSSAGSNNLCCESWYI